MKVAVLTFPGSNCDYDLYHAVKQVGGEPVWRWHRDRGLDGMDAVLLPGGFSYGDYLRAGALARFSPILEDVVAFAKAGGPRGWPATGGRSQPAFFDRLSSGKDHRSR